MGAFTSEKRHGNVQLFLNNCTTYGCPGGVFGRSERTDCSEGICPVSGVMPPM